MAEPLSAIQTIGAAVSALAAVGAGVMAGWTVLETRRLREAQTSPEVIVYLERNDRVRTVVDLVIGNIGAAPAYKVDIKTPNKPIPFGMVKEESVYVLRNGINFFPPGHRYRFSLNTYPKLPKDEVTVDVCYFAKDEIDHRPCRRQSFTLRPMEFEGFGEWQDREREANIATKTGMDSLKKAMDAFRRGLITLTVRPETRSPSDEDAWYSPEELAEPTDLSFLDEAGGGAGNAGEEDVDASKST
jgi:hypothetical protein